LGKITYFYEIYILKWTSDFKKKKKKKRERERNERKANDKIRYGSKRTKIQLA